MDIARWPARHFDSLPSPLRSVQLLLTPFTRVESWGEQTAPVTLQDTQFNRLSAEVHLPAGQLCLQLACPALFWYLPAPQLMQSLALSWEA